MEFPMNVTSGWIGREETITDVRPCRQSASAAGASIVRRLGCIESYQLALQTLNQMRGIILAYRYKIPTQLASRTAGHELVSTFERAVARVVLKHPHLHVGLVGEDTDKPCWVRLERLDLRNHIKWRTVGGGTSDLQKAFVDTSYQQLDAKFTNYRTTPGWRIEVLRQEGEDAIEVLLVFNHTNMDGRSARTFHEDLLRSLHDDDPALDKGSLRDHVLTLPAGSTASLSPPAENLAQFPVDPIALLHYVQHEVRMPAEAGYPETPTQAHWAPIAESPFKTQFRTITIPNTMLAELLEACRNNQTTLTGLLHALVFVSLTPLLGPSEATAFECMTAMDLRSLLPVHYPSYPGFRPARAVSNYVTIANHTFDEDVVAQLRSNTFEAPDSFPFGIPTDLVWTAAREVRRDLEAKLNRGVKNDVNGFAQAVDDWRAQLSKEALRPRRCSWVISNLGLVDGSPGPVSSRADDSGTKPEASAWSATRAQFIMCANVVASAINVSTVSIKGGDLVVTCSWQDCVIDADLGEAFVASLERWLVFTSRSQDGWSAPWVNSAL
ncbi:alcohol acetyltransferase-domain-containing protein [Chaetomium fimeti]|uniref:Alcohol acetyltransferase-domain-containing protein n=1 Tax=Chaetomium fimeti TaxID=1854472 RepID=A0AAE0H8K9_9PEZI|nr:alcohol acetyltransferase-domain-containing protein [Chaetomium fimeti]